MPLFDFKSGKLPERFHWFNEPQSHSFDNGLVIVTKPKTDFWQRTHYGFQRDDGHCLFTRLTGDFSFSTRVEFEPKTQYDQCGLMARVDDQNWIKCAIEFENVEISRLGSVVTHLGYSDWATQDISSAIRSAHYRLSRTGNDFLIEYSPSGEMWQQMRVTHLREAKESLDVGIYACSPTGGDFRCCFRFIEIGDCHWRHS